jgi:hypothetical protein
MLIVTRSTQPSAELFQVKMFLDFMPSLLTLGASAGIRQAATSSERRRNCIFWRPWSERNYTDRLFREQWVPQMSSE